MRARAGVNKVTFRGRLRGKPLPEGTYRLLVRARGAASDAAAVTIVVDRGRPLGPAELRAARSANVCGLRSTVDGETAETRAAVAAGGPAGPTDTQQPAQRQQPQKRANWSEHPLAGTLGAAANEGKILGARFVKAVDDANPIHPLVWAALALSILLLAVASIPTTVLATQRPTETLAYHRFEIALAGTAALGTAFLIYLIS